MSEQLLWQSVSSSNLDAIAFKNQELYARFKNRKQEKTSVYKYWPVTRAEFDKLSNSMNIGVDFQKKYVRNKNIKFKNVTNEFNK